MKKTKYVFLIVALGLITYNVKSQKKIETFTLPIESDASELNVKINCFRGRVEVEGHDKNEVVVDVMEFPAHTHTGLESSVYPGPMPDIKQHFKSKQDSIDITGLKKVKTYPTGYEIVHQGNNVYIKSEFMPNHNGKIIGFVLKVPKECNVKINTQIGGSIVLNNAVGNFECNTISNNIKATGLSGSIITNTINGLTKVIFDNVDGEDPMSFTSINGHIDITLPSGIRATFKMNSDFGEVYSNFDMETRNEIKHTGIGKPSKTKYSIKGWTVADINGGGPEITFKSLNGNIYIRKK